jgi:plastocyanin
MQARFTAAFPVICFLSAAWLILIGPTASAVAADVSIRTGAATLLDKAYSPNPISIFAGDSVVWTNKDTAAHTITSGSSTSGSNGLFDSGILAPNKTFAHTFDKSGDFSYYCMLHPSMVGKVSVTETMVAKRIFNCPACITSKTLTSSFINANGQAFKTTVTSPLLSDNEKKLSFKVDNLPQGQSGDFTIDIPKGYSPDLAKTISVNGNPVQLKNIQQLSQVP